MTAPWAVNVNGIGQFVARMKRFDEDTSKVLVSEIKVAVDGIYQAAGQTITATGNPLSNWGSWTERKRVGSRGAVTSSGGTYTRDRSYSASDAKRGLKKNVRVINKPDHQDVVAIIKQMNPAAAIYELAGSKSKSGHVFNANVNRTHPAQRWPRVLGPAWADGNKRAGQLIAAAVKRAINTVNQG